MILLSNSVNAAETTFLTDKIDQTNYAIGHQIGSDFRKQNIDLDPEAVSRGISHGYTGKQPALAPVEMRERLVKLKQKITHDMKTDAMAKSKQRQTERARKLAAGKAFLEENSSKAGVVTTESGLQYKILSNGAGAHPTKNDQVKINYVSRRLDGKMFYSSHLKGGPKIHRVSEMVPGLSEALKMMQPGAKWEVYIPHKQAYGRSGPVAYETVIIEVELLEILTQPSQASK
ncbi:MAG: FKBP-type peptidyl-prolyl cis-trans isomerase N-terminal domain-containing protein [Candidatus Thiodiazotropha taylori]